MMNMTSHITEFMNSSHPGQNSIFEAEVISYPEESALDSSKSDFKSCTGSTEQFFVKIQTAVRRDPTEGSLLVRKMNSQEEQFCPSQQMSHETGHQVQMAERVKNLNINVAADKFLLGTMGALSYNEEEGSFLMASSMEGLGPFINMERSTNFLCGGSEIPGFSRDNNGCNEEGIPNKKVKQNPRTSRPPLLPPCRVCGDRASGYHYGVNTCEACKGFFRRSICKTEPYVCTGSGDCKTVAGKRTACSHCRFKRCIAVGMSKTAIKTGRYTHELRSRNILEVKRLQKQASDESPERSSIESFTTYNDVNYTEYKNELLRKMMLEETLGTLMSGQKMLYEFLDDYYNDDLIKERQLSVYKNYMERKRKLLVQTESVTKQPERSFSLNKTNGDKSIDQNFNCPDTAAETSSQTLHSEVTMSSKTLNGQKWPTEVNVAQGKLAMPTSDINSPRNININIDPKDLNSISSQPLNLTAKNNASCMNTNTENRNTERNETGNEKEGINSDTAVLPPTESLRAEVMTKIIKDLEQGVQGMLAFAKSLPGFSDLPSPDQVSLLKAARFDIWYIGHIRCFNVELRVGACEWQFHAEELAQVWGDSMVDLAFTLSRVAKILDLTQQETAALRGVCLTFPDRCVALQNRTEVEQMHEHMLDVFKYVSCKTRSDYNKWFTKVINFLMLLREFGVKFEAISSKLTLDWSVLKDNPVLLSVFLS